MAINRRELIVGAGSTALLAALGRLQAFGLDFGTVLGAVGVGLFPGAAAALGGFELIRGLSNAADLAGHANDLVGQTQQLEAHFDSVLSQVSSTLATVQSFVKNCNDALLEIEALVKQLPGDLAAAFNQVAAAQAIARLRADTANMAGYLQSKGSIFANHAQIQTLSEKIVNDISNIDATQQNNVQFVMQVVPGLSTWVQGYTAYNLLVPGNARGANPWDHQLVSTIALPRIQATLNAIQRQHDDDVASRLPLDQGSLYTFDGTSFAKTNKSFAPNYGVGDIDNGFYYTIWPEGVAWSPPPSPPGVPPPVPGPATPKSGDLCYLIENSLGLRIWATLPPTTIIGVPPSTVAAQAVAKAYPRLLASTLKKQVAFNQLTVGWQVFDSEVKSKLINGDRDTWTRLPILST